MAKLPNKVERLPEQGRIRLGAKKQTRSGKLAPSKLTTFRFTSSDKAALDVIAATYGGTVTQWAEAGHQGEWEVTTEAKELKVVLPPGAMPDPVYELWSGGRKLLRRCDGELCREPVDSPDGPDMREVPCHCWAAQAMQCQPTTMLSVLLPDVPLGGTWRLVSHGDNAREELPAMVALIEKAAGRGFPEALLVAEPRTSPTDAKKEYVVPVLRLPSTLTELAAGSGTFRALASGHPSVAALPAGSHSFDEEDDVAEVVVVDGIEDAVVVPLSETRDKRMRTQITGIADRLGYDDDSLTDLVRILTMGDWTDSWRALPLDRLEKLAGKLAEIEAGALEWHAPDDGNPLGRLVKA